MTVTRLDLAGGPSAPVLDGVEVRAPAPDSFMPPTSYFSPEFFDLEMRAVFPKSWIFVGDIAQLREPGDFLTDRVGYEPVVVLRDRDGAVRAFSNVCPHRASLIVTGEGNCGRTLVCPYHGWTFGLDGRLVGVPYQQQFAGDVDRDRLGLREVRVEVWERFAFVNLSGDAPPLSTYLETMPVELSDHGLADVTRVYTIDDEVGVNWKILMDNAFCDYHLTFVHRASIGAFADPRTVREEIGEYTGRVKTRWSDEVLAEVEVKEELHGAAAEGSFAYSVFPNWFIAAFPSGGATVMWWTPLSIDRTRARVWNYSAHPDADPRAQYDQLKMVQEEDYAICRLVQQGLRSAQYAPGPQHELELRIRAYQSRLMRMLAEELSGQGPV